MGQHLHLKFSEFSSKVPRKKDILEIFAKFTGKDLRWSFFSVKLQS